MGCFAIATIVSFRHLAWNGLARAAIFRLAGPPTVSSGTNTLLAVKCARLEEGKRVRTTYTMLVNSIQMKSTIFQSKKIKTISVLFIVRRKADVKVNAKQA